MEEILNEAQWCGTPGKDVSVKAGEVEDSSSQMPISQELCHNRPAMSLLACICILQLSTVNTSLMFILYHCSCQLTDIIVNRQNFALLNATASITIVW